MADKTSLLDALGAHLRREFSEAEAQRVSQEQTWLDDLRQYKGVYTSEELARMGDRSRAFVRITRAKVKSLDARMMDMLFPAGKNKNWSIEITPVPELDIAQLSEDVRLQVQQAMAAGAADAEIEKIVNDEARRRMQKMEQVIEDQLSERTGNYSAVAKQVMHSGHLYGTGILKGPMSDLQVTHTWRTAEDGSYVIEQSRERRPHYKQVSIWNVYPDPYATCIEECEYIYERHIITKHDLRKLAQDPRFRGDVILNYIREHPDGDIMQPKRHEVELRQIGSTEGVRQTGKRYEVLERWGMVDGKYLRDAGLDVRDEDENVEFHAQIWVLGQSVIMAAMNRSPRQSSPYKFYYFDKDESSFWGEGVASIMRTLQRLYNSTVRMIADNATISNGPQVEINEDLVADDERPTSLAPYRIWWRRGKGQDAQAPMIRTYHFDSRVPELLRLVDLWSVLIDETTTLPKFTYGEPQKSGVVDTVGGLSMLMGQANITLKDAVKAWDDGITVPFITDMYDWNMLWNPNPDIKGDFHVVATGSSSLVSKEVRAKALDAFRATTLNPVDAPFTKRPNLLRESAKALDLDPDDAVLTDQEIKEREQEQQVLQEMQEFLGEVASSNGVTPEQLIDLVGRGNRLAIVPPAGQQPVPA